MNRKQHEAEIAEVSILILILIITTRHSKRVTTESRRRVLTINATSTSHGALAIHPVRSNRCEGDFRLIYTTPKNRARVGKHQMFYARVYLHTDFATLSIDPMIPIGSDVG